MFVYSFRASTAKFFAVVALALTTLVLLIVFVPTYAAENGSEVSTATYSYTKIKTEADRKGFLSQLGWEVKEEAHEIREVTIPSEFDKVFAAYNELQKEQGFDLSKYRKKTVTRYTYEVTNYADYEGTVYVNLIVYRNRIIGGDLCSADTAGFITGLEGR